jgi:hypothetical protein
MLLIWKRNVDQSAQEEQDPGQQMQQRWLWCRPFAACRWFEEEGNRRRPCSAEDIEQIL